MEDIRFALRDEIVNIFAMTYGDIPGAYSHQIMLCKKSKMPENRRGPFLLDSKRSASAHKLSEAGYDYYDRIKNFKYNLKYIAYIESEIKVKISLDLFEEITSAGFFPIWSPEAPYKYFNGQDEGYIVLFRVFEINTDIDENFLMKGRSGRNFYFNLEHFPKYNIKKPIFDLQ